MDELELKAAEPDGIAPSEITLDLALALHRAVGSAVLDDEAILLDPATGASHLLDASATLIMRCLDGVSSLDEIAADISEILAVERQRVDEDVLTLARTLGGLGLLEGVRRDEHSGHDHDVPQGVPPGTDLGDWEGWAELGVAGGSTLLVNWGTGCGFCTRLVPQLTELEPRLEAAGIRVRLVTKGSPEDLAGQLDGAGLTALHVEEPPAFFAGQGTPVAYLVGPDLTTADPVAVGLDQVGDLVGRLAADET
jgi:thiol-disulfide isomerase/thioredoxin